MIKGVITILFLTAAIIIGLPCAFFGMLGLTGRLADTSPVENVQAGLLFLVVAAVVFCTTGDWIWWASRNDLPDLPTQFCMRSLILVVTVIALAAGFVAVVLSL